MFAKIGSNGLASKIQKIAVFVLALVVLFSALPAGKAYAWSYATPSGRPGAASIPTIYVGDLYMPWGSTQFTLYGSTGPIAYRSPGSTGAQTVAAVYTVQKLVGSSWVTTATAGMFTGQIGATQSSYRFPTPYIQPVESRGYFRVTWTFVWHSSTGTYLGGTNVVSNLATDHVCVTTSRLCFTAAGYFYHY